MVYFHLGEQMPKCVVKVLSGSGWTDMPVPCMGGSDISMGAKGIKGVGEKAPVVGMGVEFSSWNDKAEGVRPNYYEQGLRQEGGVDRLSDEKKEFYIRLREEFPDVPEAFILETVDNNYLDTVTLPPIGP